MGSEIFRDNSYYLSLKELPASTVSHTHEKTNMPFARVVTASLPADSGILRLLLLHHFLPVLKEVNFEAKLSHENVTTTFY